MIRLDLKRGEYFYLICLRRGRVDSLRVRLSFITFSLRYCIERQRLNIEPLCCL